MLMLITIVMSISSTCWTKSISSTCSTKSYHYICSLAGLIRFSNEISVQNKFWIMSRTTRVYLTDFSQKGQIDQRLIPICQSDIDFSQVKFEDQVNDKFDSNEGTSQADRQVILHRHRRRIQVRVRGSQIPQKVHARIHVEVRFLRRAHSLQAQVLVGITQASDSVIHQPLRHVVSSISKWGNCDQSSQSIM